MLRASLLDTLIPEYDAVSSHAIRIAASPSHVYAAARHANLGNVPLVRLLMALRSIPARFVPRRRSAGPASAPPGADCSIGTADFTLIAEAPGDEFVFGIMGRFWTPAGGVVATTAADFHRPPPAGLAQGFWNFRVTACATDSELSTETRVRCGDPVTRRRFLRYWRVIRLGSGAIRTSALRHIRRSAERNAA